MGLIEVSIEGTAPLLQHRFDSINSGKPDPNISLEEIASWSLYKDPTGKIYQPGEHIEKALQKAGTQFKFKGKKTYMDFIKAGVFVKPDCIIHQIQKWEVDNRAVVINRSRIPRIRPLFKEWKLEFEIEVLIKEIDLKKINEILVYAGKFGGIGDYRPKYGRFMVTKFEIQ